MSQTTPSKPLRPKTKQDNQKYCPISNKNDVLELLVTYTLLNHRKLRYCCQIVLTALHIFGIIYGITGKIKVYIQLDQFNSKIVSFVNCLSDVLLVTVNVLTMLLLSKGEILLELRKHAFNSDFLINNRSRLFQRCVRLMRLISFIPFIINVYFMCFLISWKMYRYYLPRDMWNYSLNMIIASYLCICNNVEENYAGINQRLVEMSEIYVTSNSVPFIRRHGDSVEMDIHMKPHDYLRGLKEITRYHNQLCDLLDRFNEFLKPILALTIICNTVNIFYDLTILIEFGIKSRIINGFEISGYIITIHSLLILVAMGQAALAAYVGEKLDEEGQQTTRICFSLLNKLPIYLKTETDILIEKQLSFLLDQSKSRHVRLYAGGFFNLNWGILGSITSTVATYSIVIIQFLLK